MEYSDNELDDPAKNVGTTTSPKDTKIGKKGANAKTVTYNKQDTKNIKPEPTRRLTEKEWREMIEQELNKAIGLTQDIQDLKHNLKGQQDKAHSDNEALKTELAKIKSELMDRNDQSLKDSDALKNELKRIKASLNDQKDKSLKDNDTLNNELTRTKADLNDQKEKALEDHDALGTELKILKANDGELKNNLKDSKNKCFAVMVILFAFCVCLALRPSTVSKGPVTVDESKFLKKEDLISMENKVISLLDDKIKIVRNESDLLLLNVNKKADAGKEFLESKITDVKREIDDNINARLNDKVTDIKSSLVQIKLHGDTLDTKLDEMKNEQNHENQKTNKQVSYMNISISNMEMNMEKIQTTTLSELESSKKVIIAQVKTTIESLEGKLTGIKKAVHDMEEAERKIHKTLEKQEKLVDIMLPNVFNKGSAIVVLLVLVVAVAFLAFWVHSLSIKMGNPRDNSRSTSVGNNSNQHSHTPFNPILKRLKANQNLENAVCLLSFDQDSVKGNTTLFNAVGVSTSVKSHVINSHEDIINIPPTKLYVMFAEFTERHVIIEQQGIGLGDLKRTTLDAVYKIKGSVIIVYVRDPGSKHLKPGARFNRDIDCVTSQPELIPINRIGRFFSVFDKFTEFQKLSMHSIITDELSE